MNITAPAASAEQLNQLMVDAIAAARPVGTRDPRVLAAIRAVPRLRPRCQSRRRLQPRPGRDHQAQPRRGRAVVRLRRWDAPWSPLTAHVPDAFQAACQPSVRTCRNSST
jgi:hypothetical protein